MGPQICAAGGGGGGNPPEAPGNQEVEASGSADRMVISGRLTKNSRKLQNTKTETSSRHSGAKKVLQTSSSLPSVSFSLPVPVPVSVSVCLRNSG